MASFEDDYVVRTFSPALVDGTPDAATAGWLAATRIGFHENDDPVNVKESAIGAIDDGRVFTGVYPRTPLPGALDENWPVGTYTGYTKTINVGGGSLVDAYLVSDVTVRPTHRRRGMLRHLMTERLAAAASAGHALAALTASEATIYRRFGFGIATRKRAISVRRDRPFALLAEPSGRVELAPLSTLATVAPRVFAAFHAASPGSVDRQGQYANQYRGLDYATAKPDTDARLALHYGDDGEPDGYVLYAMKEEGNDSILQITDLVASSTTAYLGLWDYLGAVDLVSRIRWSKAPVADVLPLALVDSRSYTIDKESDHVWVRILDAPSALSARPYARDGALTIRVHDKLGHADGVFRLEVADGHGHASRVGTGSAVDLEMDAATLATMYLGGTPVSLLAAAGLVRAASPEMLTLATGMFAPDRPVYGVTEF